MTVRVATDSSAVVPLDWAEEAGLEIVPLALNWPDGTTGPADIAYAAYEAQAEARDMRATTSAPSPGVYQELSETLLETADGVVIVCPPAEMSSTYGNAVLAARAIGNERVRVIDPRTAAAGQGLVALAAARAAGSGTDLEGVVDHALDVASHVVVWATLTRLDQLRRSGRVPAIAAVGAGALGLQPVVRYAKGSPRVVAVTRSAGRACERIYRAWERSIAPPSALHLVVLHCARAPEAEDLAVRIGERCPDAAVRVTEVTAGLAAHTGPGLLGLAWWWQHLPLH